MDRDGEAVLPYATHTGRVAGPGEGEKTEYTVEVAADFPLTRFSSGGSWALHLMMNVNEWYRNPNVYAFPPDAFIMNDHARQAVLQENGATVMTVEGPLNLNFSPEGSSLQ